jgi:hypothetical protein
MAVREIPKFLRDFQQGMIIESSETRSQEERRKTQIGQYTRLRFSFSLHFVQKFIFQLGTSSSKARSRQFIKSPFFAMFPHRGQSLAGDSRNYHRRSGSIWFEPCGSSFDFQLPHSSDEHFAMGLSRISCRFGRRLQYFLGAWLPLNQIIRGRITDWGQSVGYLLLLQSLL